MSDSAFQDWLVADSWQDYKQQRAIREIESSLDGQRAESRALRSQLSRLQGSIEERLSRLIRSFDAFVELSDRRAELAGFDAAARARYRMRQILAFRAGAAPALPGTVEDVDGYWLPAAAAGLGALTRGDDAAAELERAAGRDERRTALLLVLSGATTEARWVGAAFPEPAPDAPVTTAERAVWTAAAGGRLGDAGLDLVAGRLSTLVDGLSDERRAALDRWIRDGVPSAGPAAGARLAALREWAQSTVDGPEDPHETTALVPSLVDEGSAEESATLSRIAELRAVIDDREVAPAVRWSDPAGLPLTLLVADAFGEAPGRRALARRVLHDRLLAVGQALAAETDEPDPQELTVTVEGQTVRVRTGGPVPADVDAAHRAIDARYPAPPSKAWQRYAWFGAGVVALGLALAVPLGLAVVLVLLALIFAFVGVRRIFADRLEANEQQERLRAARERADKAIEAQRQSLIARCRRLDEARRQAPADLSALRSALNGEPLTSE